MIKSWFIGDLNIKIKHERGLWRWSVSKYGSTEEITGKHKDEGIALCAALDALSHLASVHRVKG